MSLAVLTTPYNPFTNWFKSKDHRICPPFYCGSFVNLGKKLGAYSWERFINLPYDCYWRGGALPGTLEQVERCALLPPPDASCSLNNREIFDDNSAQRLSRDDLMQMKEDGRNPEEIVSSLVQHSDSFCLKTEFSQEKYLRKKRDKYAKAFRISAVTPQSLYLVYATKTPNRILWMRQDTLSQLLCIANISHGSQCLVVDDTHGFLSFALLDRMSADYSCGLALVESSHPDILRYSSIDYSSRICSTKSEVLTSDEASDSLPENQRKCRDLFKRQQYDCLIIAIDRYDPLPVVSCLGCGLKPSGQLVIYHPFKEALLGCYSELRGSRSDDFINVSLTESFLREYQVLEGRMHPFMKTIGPSGFLLSATKIISMRASGEN